MKVLIIPDMHGSHNWEKAKAIVKEHPDYYVVGLGDWADSGIYNRKLSVWQNNNKWPDQGENLKNALEWFSEDKEHRFFCLGNHDWAYLTMTRGGQYVSGHQSGHASEIRSILNSYKDILHIGKELDGWVFSHAGFTENWVNSYMIPQLHKMFDKWPEEDDGKPLVWDESEFSVDFLNKVFRSLDHIPGDPNSDYGFDELLDWHGAFSGTGDEVMQGPYWVRPSALLRSHYYPNQVVGHTEMCIGEPVKLKSKDSRVVILDSTDHDLIYVFDTENPGDDFLFEADFNRLIKKINKAIGTIWSMKITDEDAIRNELLSSGVKKHQLDEYVKLIKSNM